jgi:PAS domain S-box-containing protein
VDLARWLVAHRPRIEAQLAARLGPAAPGAGDAESELLRRFRSFAASALQRGSAAEPALDGLRVDERRGLALLAAWCEAAGEVAGERGGELRSALAPLVERFRVRLRATGERRRAHGAPRATRRAVWAAIDRVADAFLALEADSGRLVDANPAAGALLGVARDALLGVDAMAFVPPAARELWWTHLDALTEGSEPRRFHSALCDASGAAIPVECSVTRYAQRGRTLALVVARPR